MFREEGGNAFKRRHPWVTRFLYIWCGLMIVLYPVARIAGYQDAKWAAYYFFASFGVFFLIMLMLLMVDSIRDRHRDGDR